IVQNEGKGIPENKLAYVFDPIYQADEARNKQNRHGTGLGLSITKQMIEKHHGEIEIFSKESIATCVICKLPKFMEGVKNENKKTKLTYYDESTSTVSEDEKEIEVVKMKEWRNEDGKIRVELENENGEEQAITVNDGESIITYQKEINQAFIIDDEEILELNQPSPKEQVDFILGMVKDTHDISTEGEEEEVAGRTTVHLIATPKEDDALLGEQEIWIDKENWMVLKTI